jgi:small GTP-binding protein
MLKKLSFSMKGVCPILVIGTMSSGKSTLINALAGNDLLPSRNRACTAKEVAILVNDWKLQFAIHKIDSNGKYSLVEKATPKDISDFNQANDITEMIIEGAIKGIKSHKKLLLIIDTPGVNSMNPVHEKVTKEVVDEYLDECLEGLILYVINAQQIAVYDDNVFLTYIAGRLKKNSDFNIIFVINKMDSIDLAREKQEELLADCKKYIQERGIVNPVLIPVSAGSALLFRKVLNEEDISEFEEENFARDFSHYKRKEHSVVDQMSGWGGETDFVQIDGARYTKAEIYAALKNTGIVTLENELAKHY